MIIQVDGVGTVNKGAELMFFAILQEIERTYPDATVIFNDATYLESNQQPDYFQSSLKIVKPYYMRPRFVSVLKRFHIYGLINRLNSSWNLSHVFHHLYNYDIDLLLDASGFKFSDQFNLTAKHSSYLKTYLSNYKGYGAKIVFLPQAFGPIIKPGTELCVKELYQYADLIFARDKVSFDYMSQFRPSNSPLFLAPDFTSLVKGCSPKEYLGLKNHVCLIPNMQMVRKGVTSYNEYLEFWLQVISVIKEKHIPMFVLNHEGNGDEKLSDDICKKTGIIKVSRLNAIEIKGVISQSMLVISSRFHGVANALSSSVPCLATSWSHKYQFLFEDYGVTDCVLDMSNKSNVEDKIVSFLDEKNNTNIRKQLSSRKCDIDNRCRAMWNSIWNLIKKTND